MISKQIIEEVIRLQETQPRQKNIIDRNIQVNQSSLITIITGIRRCGKSVFLRQLQKQFKKAGYLNFEDPRLEGFSVKDFYKLEEIFSSDYYFFDEIQNIQNWEKYARQAHDAGKKIFITGSNASMLSRELGTLLTGRHRNIELFPFSFKEYLQFRNLAASEKSFENYLKDGGFPEFLKSRDQEYLQILLKDIIARDIIVRRGIRNEETLNSLAIYLLSNIGKIFSYNNVSKILNIKSVRTTIDFCNYLQDSYILEMIPNFAYSIKHQLINPKKIYAIDTGLIKANTLSFSKDIGRILENIIYLHLRRGFSNIYYFKEDTECDFIVKDKIPILAIQVCYELNDLNLEREISGLKNAMSKTKVKKGIILTMNQEDNINGVNVMPVWKYLID